VAAFSIILKLNKQALKLGSFSRSRTKPREGLESYKIERALRKQRIPKSLPLGLLSAWAWVSCVTWSDQCRHCFIPAEISGTVATEGKVGLGQAVGTSCSHYFISSYIHQGFDHSDRHRPCLRPARPTGGLARLRCGFDAHHFRNRCDRLDGGSSTRERCSRARSPDGEPVLHRNRRR